MGLLITTSLPGLEDETGNIYLGNWCSRDNYILKHKDVITYHWDDREKLKKDYIYLNNLYEKLLLAATKELNKIHGVNFSVNYWRIHLGYWIFLFLGSFFEKWENISKAFRDRSDITFTKIIKNNFIPDYRDTPEFLNSSSSEEWNHIIYAEILKYLNDKKIIKINFESISKEMRIYRIFKPNLIFKLKNKLIKIYNYLFKFRIQNQKVFIYRSYTGKIFEFLLNLSFGQLPVYIEKFYSSSGRNSQIRENEISNLDATNEFEKFIKINFLKHIPKCFLEDFDNIGKFIKKKSIPQKPKVLFSTIAVYSDDIFTRICAAQKEFEENSFIYCQHGGVYGQIAYTWAEEHESKISDLYLTWGWKSENQKNIIDFGIIKNIQNFKFKKSKKIDKVIYFLRSRPKYPSRIDSSTGANTMCKYYENCLNFFKNPLIKIFNNKIKVRFHERNFGWNHEEIWNKELPNINLSKSSDETLADVYKKNDLIIYSYIGTGFLESLALDKPNILISKLNEWPLKKDVIYYFNKLKDAGIFFETNEEALIHLKKYRYSLKEWWYNPEVVKIKNEFKTQFVNLMAVIKKKMNELKIIIKQKMSNNEK
jgi:putative transferase (TIGR04331 family)